MVWRREEGLDEVSVLVAEVTDAETAPVPRRGRSRRSGRCILILSADLVDLRFAFADELIEALRAGALAKDGEARVRREDRRHGLIAGLGQRVGRVADRRELFGRVWTVELAI